MKRIALVAVVAAAALAAGCGSARRTASAQTTTTATTTPPSRSRPAAQPGTLVKVRRSEFGRVLVDRRGQALYLFTKDGRGPSRCARECTTAWPPLYASGNPVAGAGVDTAKLGTVRHGRRLQVTYAGNPLYLYHADTPTQILCQNVNEFGGLWLVVKPSGAPVR
ncbi:MAG: hypothetical protein M3155_08325 [Actinomycetota bacterium]|nr:hypothetical protein [Actinomycetota bacterium]